MFYDFFLILKNPHLRSRGLQLLAGWLLATTSGWAAAGLTGLPIGRVVVVEGGPAALLAVAGNMGLIGGLIGALVGAGQWLFLRRRSHGAIAWLLATSAGWAVGLPAALLALNYFSMGITAGFYGLAVGFCVGTAQWLANRTLVPNYRRWLLATLLAYILGIGAAGALERSLLIATEGAWGAAPWQTSLTAAAAGVIAGLFSGIAMVAFLAGRRGPTDAA